MLDVSLITNTNKDQERGVKRCPNCRKQVAMNELADFIYCEQGVIQAGIYRIEKYPYKVSEIEDQWYSHKSNRSDYIEGTITLIEPTYLSNTWPKILSFWWLSNHKEGRLCRNCAKKYANA